MLHIHKNKCVVTVLLTACIAFGSFAFRAPNARPEEPHPENLKILPKDITHPELMAVMHNFCSSLNYKCEDCHAPSVTNPKKLDFASDANPKKDEARYMMRMVKKLNRKFFKVRGKFAENFVHAKYEVSCYTCHHGGEHPMKMPPMKKRKK